MQEPNEPEVLALVRDLLFSSRIKSTAAALGVPVALLRNPMDLAAQQGRLLLVDLNLDGALEAAASWRMVSGRSVIGFVAHVDAATIIKARESGLDRVLARSGFLQVLPDLLSGNPS